MRRASRPPAGCCSSGRGPPRREAPRLGPGPPAPPLAAAQAAGAPHGEARAPPRRAAALQPAGGPELPPAGRLPVLLDLRVPHLGRAVPGSLVHAHPAVPDRAHDEGTPPTSPPPRPT